jgi:hypothetical protein
MMICIRLAIIGCIILNSALFGMKKEEKALMQTLPEELQAKIVIDSLADNSISCFQHLEDVPYRNLMFVCKEWKNILSTKHCVALYRKTVLSVYGAPDMHRYAAKNDWKAILALKKQGNSLYVRDRNGCTAYCYALQCNTQKTMQLLRIGGASKLFCERHNKQAIHDSVVTKCNINDVSMVLSDAKDSKELIFILDQLETATIDAYDDTISRVLNSCLSVYESERDILEYALQSSLELRLFSVIHNYPNEDSGVLDLMEKFKKAGCNPHLCDDNNKSYLDLVQDNLNLADFLYFLLLLPNLKETPQTIELKKKHAEALEQFKLLYYYLFY